MEHRRSIGGWAFVNCPMVCFTRKRFKVIPALCSSAISTVMWRAFKQASEKLQGAALAIGDAGYVFQVLPDSSWLWSCGRATMSSPRKRRYCFRKRAALFDDRRAGDCRQFVDRANRESSESMNDSLAIQTQALTKSYGKVQALRGVDLEVKRGEVFGFLGPNGSGKTTTIRCLLDLIRPDGGTLRVLGLDPQRESVTVRAQIGYLPGELAHRRIVHGGSGAAVFQPPARQSRRLGLRAPVGRSIES